MSRNQCTSQPWQGLLAGMVAGVAASWVMERFQTAWSRWSARRAQAQRSNSGQSRQQEHGNGEDQTPATVKAAAAISQRFFHHQLADREKRIAGPAVHYAFGAAVGGLYGVLAGVAPKVTKAAGLPFGAALWLAADEAAVPAFGLSKPPTRYPVSTHLHALASHLVYGLTTEAVRRAICRTLRVHPGPDVRRLLAARSRPLPLLYRLRHFARGTAR